MGLEGLLAGLVAIVFGVIAAYVKGRSVERRRQKQRRDRKTAESVRKAYEVERNLESEPDPDKRLRERWQRD